MVEFTFITGEKEKKQTIASDIGEAGVHIFTDKGFFDRVDDISVFFTNYLSEAEIQSKKLSPIRENLLRRAMKAAEYIFSQSAYGKGAERPKVLGALQSVNDLLLYVEECVDSDIDDDDCALICRDITSQTLKVPPALFDSQNTTVNKTFTVQGMPKAGGSFEGQVLDEDTAEALMKLKDDQWRQKHGK